MVLVASAARPTLLLFDHVHSLPFKKVGKIASGMGCMQDICWGYRKKKTKTHECRLIGRIE
jgi:hypothetical protein